jgi:hypothetical protein
VAHAVCTNTTRGDTLVRTAACERARHRSCSGDVLDRATRTRRQASCLLYAAAQFVVLTACAMAVYAGGSYMNPDAPGYAFTRNFFSDLGATHTWRGRNTPSAVLFAIALATVGAAFLAFTGAWRGFAFGRARARIAGHAADVFGVIAGACFLGVACAPVNLALHVHNTLVVGAFGALLGYAAAITIALWRNGAARALVAVAAGYLLVVLGYVATIVHALVAGISTDAGYMTMVIAQKIVVYLSMAFVIYLTLTVRRLARPRP